jgi:hypothetical protein
MKHGASFQFAGWLGGDTAINNPLDFSLPFAWPFWLDGEPAKAVTPPAIMAAAGAERR